MEVFKKVKIYFILNAIAVIALGVMILAAPGKFNDTIAIITGTVIATLGVVDLLQYIGSLKKDEPDSSELYSSTFKVLLGVFMIFHTSLVITLFTYIFSIFIAINGVQCAENSFKLKKANDNRWIINLVLSVALLVAGCITLFEPFGTIKKNLTATGILLIVDGVVVFFNAICSRTILKEEKIAYKEAKSRGED